MPDPNANERNEPLEYETSPAADGSTSRIRITDTPDGAVVETTTRHRDGTSTTTTSLPGGEDNGEYYPPTTTTVERDKDGNIISTRQEESSDGAPPSSSPEDSPETDEQPSEDDPEETDTKCDASCKAWAFIKGAVTSAVIGIAVGAALSAALAGASVGTVIGVTVLGVGLALWGAYNTWSRWGSMSTQEQWGTYGEIFGGAVTGIAGILRRPKPTNIPKPNKKPDVTSPRPKPEPDNAPPAPPRPNRRPDGDEIDPPPPRRPTDSLFRNNIDDATKNALHDYPVKFGGNGNRLAPELSKMTPDEFLAKLDDEVAKGLVGPPRIDSTGQRIYEYSDGTVVRYKPNGDSFGRKPAASIEIKKDPSLPDKGPGGIAFKLDANGNPVPKGPKDVLNPFPKGTSEHSQFELDVMNQGHWDLGKN